MDNNMEPGSLTGKQLIRKSDAILEVQKIAEGEGLLVKESDGGIKLEEEVKEKIIRAFKEEAIEEDIPEKKVRRVFMRDEIDEEEKAQSAALKALEEARKEIAETSEEEHQEAEGLEAEITGQKDLNLSQAELVMVSSPEHAMGLSYSPGKVPRIVALAARKKAEKMIEDAFKLGIPVVEIVDWDCKNFKELKIGEEIPENIYPFAAKALALIYRIKPDAYLVRFVKPAKEVKSKNKTKLKKRIAAMEDILNLSRLSVEVGEDLYKYKDEMNTQLELTSSRLTAELGLPLPQVDIKSANGLKPDEFILKLREVTYRHDHLDTSFEPPTLFFQLQSALKSLVYEYSYELLGYPETEALLANIKKSNPSLVKSLFPHHFTVGALRFVLRGLLKEKIPIKDMETILQTIEDNISHTTDPELLIEYIRSAFSHFISSTYRDEQGNLNVILLSREVELMIMESIREAANVRWLDMDYDLGIELLTDMNKQLQKTGELGIPVMFLTSPIIRRFVRKITEASFPGIPVLAYSEISPLAPVKTVGLVNLGKQKGA